MQSETGFLENQDGDRGSGIEDRGPRIDDKLKENQHTEMTVIRYIVSL